MTPTLVTLFLVAVVLLPVALVARRPGPLSDLAWVDNEVVVTVHAPVWLAARRRLSAPAAAVTGIRVLPPGAPLRLRLRVFGTWWPGMALGYHWGPGGLCYVVRRRNRAAVEITLSQGRVRRWVVETSDVPATAPVSR